VSLWCPVLRSHIFRVLLLLLLVVVVVVIVVVVVVVNFALSKGCRIFSLTKLLIILQEVLAGIAMYLTSVDLSVHCLLFNVLHVRSKMRPSGSQFTRRRGCIGIKQLLSMQACFKTKYVPVVYHSFAYT